MNKKNLKIKSFIKLLSFLIFVFYLLLITNNLALAVGKDDEDCKAKGSQWSCTDTSTLSQDLTCESGLCHGIYKEAKFKCCKKFEGQAACLTSHPEDGECAKGDKCPGGKSEDKGANLCPFDQKCCFKTAATPNLQLEIPIFGYTNATNIAEYIKNLYQYAIYALVPIGIVIIIAAGIMWILAGGNLAKIKQAKKYISGAIIGITIGLLSYVILSLVGITELKMPQIEYIEPMPIPILDGEFEQPDTFNQIPSSGAPPVAGTMPRIFQCDYRNVPWPNCASKNVCTSGCGLTSVTMVLRYYGKNISIQQTVQFMGNGGYIGCGIIGVSPTGFGAIARANGLSYKKVSIDFNSLKNYVAGGKPIIANVGNPGPGRACKYTAHGHFIVLSGWDAPNNRFIINDPGGRATNRYNGTWDDLTKSCIFKGAYYVGN